MELLSQLTTKLQMAVSLAQERGASSWLTALPVQEHGFSLHKTAFRDALALRYGWLPSCIHFIIKQLMFKTVLIWISQ